MRTTERAAVFRAMRRAAGITARGLADLLGVAPETVSHWERGRLPVPRMAFALLRMLALDAAEDGDIVRRILLDS